ncbi:hypothetical protein [Kitasatospora sp. MAP5-34]|uniref:hypothetical protein n=1 Tax=Kitasatospora sp. MAP5-34 TaxID=3035102 RepID=UPI002472FE5C|nr:hypothetical protein [Kitasatospora sp. MAP5-34]MDH6578241.1 hypothetical protein [Kitasatospora sp. MAP5-34]
MSVVEYYPGEFPGLHWEAAAGPEVEEVVGFVLAVTEDDRVAVANVNRPDAVAVATVGELAVLRDAFVSGRFDSLLSEGQQTGHIPGAPGMTSLSARSAVRALRRLI